MVSVRLYPSQFTLLHEIQESVVQEGADLGSVLLKLRFLASRLGSDVLEEWVKHESEGYPNDVEVPPYRIVGVSYKGMFSGPFGSGIQNAPIPGHLIKQFAGESWVSYKIRESIAGIDELVRSSTESGSLGIDASNLILLLQGKIYPDYACNSVSGRISRTSLTEIQQAVRARILELTLELEKSIPAAADVAFGASKGRDTNPEKVQQITQQIIYGNVTTAVAGGHGSNISINVNERDSDSFVRHLVESGIVEEDAKSLASILETEEPEGEQEPFGKKAKNWIASNLKKAVDGTWKIGLSVATAVITEAAKKYYGL
ncbi:hypothetical protein [Oceanidesulfovibrio marinus]|uniref:AbiTii domain-containing protein n=1 Tax=Oceanidesulfovibrio marinus TaxID=370038 RepID=A0A6P1ZF79_9BACT|nr:hypothetical protein [Oceanidesulfovibrio marinus]TVM31939.1 hypothetical protein DQK91_16580 [Oceanidesulfovibrio marinus]